MKSLLNLMFWSAKMVETAVTIPLRVREEPFVWRPLEFLIMEHYRLVLNGVKLFGNDHTRGSSGGRIAFMANGQVQVGQVGFMENGCQMMAWFLWTVPIWTQL